MERSDLNLIEQHYYEAAMIQMKNNGSAIIDFHIKGVINYAPTSFFKVPVDRFIEICLLAKKDYLDMPFENDKNPDQLKENDEDSFHQTMKYWFNKLTDCQRMEIIDDYCKHCGSKDTGCQCWNDA
ncbi:hypothetical protein [Roseivirga seohaensis]|uniref:hypothetical protein n=1 Tax=Roseivirga seohaensis TaxID=1914963 RepID=UPI003BADB8FC